MSDTGVIGSKLGILKGANALKTAGGAVQTKGFTRQKRGSRKVSDVVFIAAKGETIAAPTSDATEDCPGRLGALYWDSSADDWYVCSSYTSESAFTWTKIVD